MRNGGCGDGQLRLQQSMFDTRVVTPTSPLPPRVTASRDSRLPLALPLAARPFGRPARRGDERRGAEGADRLDGRYLPRNVTYVASYPPQVVVVERAHDHQRIYRAERVRTCALVPSIRA